MKARLLPAKLLNPVTRQELRSRLDAFYTEGSSYTAFQQPSDQRHSWALIKNQIEHLVNTRGVARVHILEIGAGRTGFARFLEAEGLRSSVVFYVQDVTRFNKIWLDAEADFSFFGDVSDCVTPRKMDIVFSTYVLEHVTDPQPHLDYLWSLVSAAPGHEGTLFLFSPRYDLPGYLCPSARHLPAAVRLFFLAYAFVSRLRTLLTGRPAFLIQTDLAAFHRPFYLDADAVHWVSAFDLKAWARIHSGQFEVMRFESARKFTKDWIIKRFCTTAVKITKSVNETNSS